MANYDLARFRREHGLTQRQLADKLNVTQGFMSSVETGRVPFPEERLKDFQAIFPDADLSQYEINEQEKAAAQSFLERMRHSTAALFLMPEGVDEDEVEEIIKEQGEVEEPNLFDDAVVDRLVPGLREAVRKLLDRADELENANIAYSQKIDEIEDDHEAVRKERDKYAEDNKKLQQDLFDARSELYKSQQETIRLQKILLEHGITQF